MNILLVGGAGYIGSHIALQLAEEGLNPIIYDNFSTSKSGSVVRLNKILGNKLSLVFADARDQKSVITALQDFNIELVVHLAAFKSVAESVLNPIKYYSNNVGGMLTLLESMDQCHIKNLIFSSSCTVYGDSNDLPVTEKSKKSHTNPYGHSKIICEDILLNQLERDPSWRVGILRYFNPAGAHPSGEIGEDPKGKYINLMPMISKVALGQEKFVPIYGDDYPTKDGTAVRDYIHIMDLVDAHIRSIRALHSHGSHAVNLGSSIGFSVLDIIKTYESVCNKKIPIKVFPKRIGDVPSSYADSRLAESILGWQPKYSLSNMCLSSHNWKLSNPYGYQSD